MKRTRGFTLIEVLVALAIVTVGMAALLSALSTSADSASYLRDKTFAQWVALNRLAEVRTALQRPTKGKADGEVEMAGRRWKWAQEVLDTDVKGILRIDVSVRPLDVPGSTDTNWMTTVSGITGDALAPPTGYIDPFSAPPPSGGPGGQGGGAGGGGEGEPGNGGKQQPAPPTPGVTNPPGQPPPNPTD